MSELITGKTNEQKAQEVQAVTYDLLLAAKSIQWNDIEPTLKINIFAMLGCLRSRILDQS